MTIKTNQPLINERDALTARVAAFWNQVTEGWREIWGQHIHHGYYEGEAISNDQEAQERLMQKLVDLLDLQPGITILDAGCGMGGSSFYLAERFEAEVLGITLSQKQVDLATQEAEKRRERKLTFRVEDALSMTNIPSQSLDLVWSLESCEQFYDKPLFLRQAFRVLKPGGKLMLATWCSSQDEYQGKLAKRYQKLCEAFDLPYMPSLHYYEKALKETGFKIRQKADWSSAVEPSWKQGIDLAKAYSFFKLLFLGGLRGLRFVGQLRLMKEGYENGMVKYGVFCAEK